MKRALQNRNPFANGLHLDHAYAWESVAQRHEEVGELFIMDYGCYDGALIRALAESFPDVTAVGADKNCEAVREGNEISTGGKVTLYCPDDLIEWVKSYDQKCDVVLAMGVVEHVVEQRSLLEALASALKPDGVLVMAVPGQHTFSWADLGNLKFHFPKTHRAFVSLTKGREYYQKNFVECENGLFGDIEVEKGIHEHFTRQDLSRLVESAGFKVVDVDGWGHYYRLLKPLVLISPGFVRARIESLANKDLREGASTELVLEASR